MKPLLRHSAVKWPGRGGARGQRGATMVEFVIVGPIAILVIMALVQLGLMMTAKQVLNEATFEGARMGASEHAQKQDVMRALTRKLLPFYQDSTKPDATARLGGAALSELVDISIPFRLKVARLSPPESAFSDFGLNVNDGSGNHVAIPNDNLEYRAYDAYKGQQSGLTIQDANELRIQVVYAYELKVPLMKTVFKSVMCGIDSGVNAFGRGSLLAGLGNVTDCLEYYMQGRIPITSYATVQMQSDAWQDSAWN